MEGREMEHNAATAVHPWSIDPAAVRDATLAIITDADACHFAAVAFEKFGIPDLEAKLLGDHIAITRKRAHGCV
jgi:hypothetical protein